MPAASPDSMKNNNALRYLVLLSPYLLLALTCLFNLSWNISDHDDGHTLGFHAMGRNPDIQRSYGCYDSMCDYLLGFLPVQYKFLYGAMVGASVLAAFGILYLSKKLLTTLFPLSPEQASLGLALFLLGMPEFLYMSFTFKSVYISLAFILWAFYLLVKKPSPGNVLLPAVLFGLGVSLRWNLVMYGLPVAAVVFWQLREKKELKKGILISGAWGVAALLFSVLFIWISGYAPNKLVEAYLWGKTYAGATDFQLIARVGDLSVFITPASALFLLLGAIAIRKQVLAWVWIIASLLPFALLGFAPSFKFLAALWPVFMLLAAYAVQFSQKQQAPARSLITGLFVAGLAVNWFAGVQVDTATSNWGPGLDVKDDLGDYSVFSAQRTDDRFKLENVRVGFHDGLCLPTSEGMRPLYGHAYALFGGRLSALDKKLNHETDRVVALASENKGIIYQDRVNPYLLASYLRMGCTTTDPWTRDGDFTRRTFRTPGQLTFTELRINNPRDLFDMEMLRQQVAITDTLYLSFTYTSALNKFLHTWSNEYHYPFEKLGAQSAKVYFSQDTAAFSPR